MLANAGIRNTDGLSTSPVNTTTTLWRSHWKWLPDCPNDKLFIQQENPNPKDSHIDLLTFGTVQVRNLVSRCLHLNSLYLQIDKLTVLRQLLIICWAISTYIWSKCVLSDQNFKGLSYLTIRTAVIVVLPLAVSRSATPLSSSVITIRSLGEGQAIPYSSQLTAKCRRSELPGYINTFW
jgi:hypothetical protein